MRTGTGCEAFAIRKVVCGSGADLPADRLKPALLELLHDALLIPLRLVQRGKKVVAGP